jgi:ribosomal protein S18 acetylase RimI-like enzyme
VTEAHPLDNPARASLLGAHARFSERRGAVLRYQVDVAPFLALPDRPDDSVWDDVAALVGAGGVVPVAISGPPPPPHWETVMELDGVQMVDQGMDARPDPEAVTLGGDDVVEMLDLIDRTRPGPFMPRTVELGTYLGIRRDGALVAMAGERFHPPGWTEVSAVCTDDAFRGQGLATRLLRAVASGIRGRDETPFLHTVANNTNAIRLYESLGFRVRRRVTFTVVRVPAAE